MLGLGKQKDKGGRARPSSSSAGSHRLALSADAPISRVGDDLLGRSGFVRALADEVRRAPRESGFVIGLTGPWGSGKTSVLELVGAELGEDEVTAVIRFNPWLFSGTEQLIEHFFAELSGQLEALGSRNIKRLAKALRGYGRVVSTFRYLPYIGEIARVSSEAAKDAGSALAGDKETTARFRADQLCEQLDALDRPIVILLDDLDRLRQEEIVDVVRLVRLIGDFPNLIYLLAFDRPAVEAALGATRADGRHYLEKIIHLSHDLPPIRPENLTKVISEALAEISPAVYRFDLDRYASLFWTEVRPMFATVRDVHRYKNVLAATLSLVGDEVDFTDVLALEAIRLFEPEFFEAIVENRDLLTGNPTRNTVLAALEPDDDTAKRIQLEKIASVATGKADAEALLKRLFPLCEYLLGAVLTAPTDAGPSEWRAKHRVADLAVFDAYLYRRLPEGALPSRDVEGVVRALGDEKQLDEIFSALGDAELQSVFDQLGHYEREFTPDVAVPAINVILRQESRLAVDLGGLAGPLLVQRFLRSLSHDQVVDTLRQVDFPDLSSRYRVVRMVGNSESGGHRLVGEPEARQLERSLSEAVLASTAERLGGEEELGPLIVLLERTQAEALRRNLREWLRSDRFFVRFLASHRITSFGGPGGATAHGATQLLWPKVVEAIGGTELRRRLTEIDPAWVESEFDSETAAAWRQALRYSDDPEAGERDAAPYMSI